MTFSCSTSYSIQYYYRIKIFSYKFVTIKMKNRLIKSDVDFRPTYENILTRIKKYPAPKSNITFNSNYVHDKTLTHNYV